MTFYALKKDDMYIALGEGYYWTDDIRDALKLSTKYNLVTIQRSHGGNIVAVHIEVYE